MIAGAIAAACTDDDVLACIGGPLGEAVRAEAAALRRMPESSRKQARAMASAVVRTPLLAGLRTIHPTWIEAALGGLPNRARSNLASPTFDPTAVWLARWAAASLAPLPPVELVRPKTIDDIPRLSSESILAWLRDVGADQLAFALGAPSQWIEPHVLARIAQPPRAGNLGQRRAAIARCKVALDDEALVIIGARALAPHTDAFVRRHLVLRLPRTRGLAVLFELAQWASDLAASPTWAAITATSHR
ncbi:MAG: hypothetical protein M4D80_38560 [Myxococcota bacterium]|nr:hypothetical protein [Myxococcota bacterium]